MVCGFIIGNLGLLSPFEAVDLGWEYLVMITS